MQLAADFVQASEIFNASPSASSTTRRSHADASATRSRSTAVAGGRARFGRGKAARQAICIECCGDGSALHEIDALKRAHTGIGGPSDAICAIDSILARFSRPLRARG